MKYEKSSAEKATVKTFEMDIDDRRYLSREIIDQMVENSVQMFFENSGITVEGAKKYIGNYDAPRTKRMMDFSYGAVCHLALIDIRQDDTLNSIAKRLSDQIYSITALHNFGDAGIFRHYAGISISSVKDGVKGSIQTMTPDYYVKEVDKMSGLIFMLSSVNLRRLERMKQIKVS